ncbi:MAG: plasmid replication protein RepC [Pseudomonadota bacterium]
MEHTDSFYAGRHSRGEQNNFAQTHARPSHFGGAPVTPALMAVYADVKKRRARIAAAREAAGGTTNDDGRAHKWKVIDALTEARFQFGLGDRAIRVLEALVSCHPGDEIDGMQDAIVFPSNSELTRRTKGMAGATLRRHIATLCAAGLIMRRDSANGKRYCRRAADGQPAERFGFDLAPLALLARDIHASAEMVRAERAETRRTRTAITIHLRDVAKLVEAGEGRAINAGEYGAWAELRQRLASLSGRVGRTTPLDRHHVRLSALRDLLDEAENLWLSMMSSEEMDANAAHSEHHIQISKTEHHIESSQRDDWKAEAPKRDIKGEFNGRGTENSTIETEDVEAGPSVPALSDIVSVAPDIVPYAPDGRIRVWRDMIAAAGLVRTMLGISPSAYEAAQAAMGAHVAATTIALMLMRVDTIKSPGGYLRALTLKAQDGKFSLRPMMEAQRNRR